mmetsp:Transcript_105568/g.308706  ORF Transcript_105568/g.308706 Transcript_105568/m.308706 type:complete len:297 (-) Transcript_105568:54-944(-)
MNLHRVHAQAQPHLALVRLLQGQLRPGVEAFQRKRRQGNVQVTIAHNTEHVGERQKPQDVRRELTVLPQNEGREDFQVEGGGGVPQSTVDQHPQGLDPGVGREAREVGLRLRQRPRVVGGDRGRSQEAADRPAGVGQELGALGLDEAVDLAAHDLLQRHVQDGLNKTAHNLQNTGEHAARKCKAFHPDVRGAVVGLDGLGQRRRAVVRHDLDGPARRGVRDLRDHVPLAAQGGEPGGEGLPMQLAIDMEPVHPQIEPRIRRNRGVHVVDLEVAADAIAYGDIEAGLHLARVRYVHL